MKAVITMIVLLMISSQVQASETDLTKEDWVSLNKYLHPNIEGHEHKNVLMGVGQGSVNGQKFFWSVYADHESMLRWEFSHPINILELSSTAWVQKFCTPSGKECDKWAATDAAVSEMLEANSGEKDLKMKVSVYY